MQYIATDFMNIRNLILKNVTLNALLIASLCNTCEPVKVNCSLERLQGRTRRLMHEEKGEKAKLPKYVLADVLVTLTAEAKIGNSYAHYPPYWQKSISLIEGSYISRLKKLTSEVHRIYSIHAAKADKIFSNMPESLGILLEKNQISRNYWKSGFSKKLKTDLPDNIDEKELDQYYQSLWARHKDWQMFNRILIELVKHRRFDHENPDYGKVSIKVFSSENKLYITFTSYIDNFSSSTISPYDILKPTEWERYNADVDLSVLRRVFLA